MLRLALKSSKARAKGGSKMGRPLVDSVAEVTGIAGTT